MPIGRDAGGSRHQGGGASVVEGRNSPGGRKTVFQPDPNIDIEQLRVRFGYRVILWGFLLVGLSLVVAWGVWNARTADMKFSDVVSIVTAVTGIVGTLVGAFFGVSASATARDQAEKARQDTQALANKALAALPPDAAAKVVQ